MSRKRTSRKWRYRKYFKAVITERDGRVVAEITFTPSVQARLSGVALAKYFGLLNKLAKAIAKEPYVEKVEEPSDPFLYLTTYLKLNWFIPYLLVPSGRCPSKSACSPLGRLVAYLRFP